MTIKKPYILVLILVYLVIETHIVASMMPVFQSSEDIQIGWPDTLSRERMLEIAQSVIEVEFRYEDYRILQKDVLKGGDFEQHSPIISQLIQYRYDRIGKSSYPSYNPVRYTVDSTLNSGDSLLVVSGVTYRQNINASIPARTKRLAIDDQGRYYFLHGFGADNLTDLADNLMNRGTTKTSLELIAEIYIKHIQFARPITTEYLQNNWHLVEKFGELLIESHQQVDSLSLSMYGDKLLVTKWKEPVQSTVVHYQFSYSKQSGLSYTIDTLGVIRYPNSDD